MDSRQLKAKLRHLFASQGLGVLATESEGHPHSSLVAIADTDDLRHLVFCTSRETRKYRNLKSNPRVSLLADTRSNSESDFRESLAVSAIGEAAEIEGGEELRRMKAAYVAKHGHLAAFVSSPGNALIRLDVSLYLVNSFDESWSVRIDQHGGDGARL